MSAESFGARLSAITAQRGSLCVGIDPHRELLAAWGLPITAAGLRQFCLTVLDALGELVAVFKPQSAFFEAFGGAGITVLEQVIQHAREAGALVLLDAKRGDIGSTMNAYAHAYLTDDSPLAADALTVSPYLGFDSLRPAIDAAGSSGRGLFVLCRTSNPHADQVQQAVRPDSGTVAQLIVDDVAALNSPGVPGSFGVVIGATVGTLELDLSQLNGPILAPGLGAQGADADDLKRLFGPQLRNVLPTSSRDILAAGPDQDRLVDAVRRQQQELAG